MRLLRQALIVLLALGSAAGIARAEIPTARAEALRLLQEGEAAPAAAILDSLLREDPTDLAAGYLAARADESAGREDRARCRYLRLEGTASGTEAALLAAARRLALERRRTDALVAQGPDLSESGMEGGRITGSILILPPDPLGAPDQVTGFGLAWSYLLFEALRGSDLCPVSVPSALAVLDLLQRGHAVRSTGAVAARPVNTVEGLRARLACLAGSDGAPYLESAGGGWDPALESALIRFQQAQGIPPTGEADLQTQARLEEVLGAWLQQSPPSLDPKLVPRAASWLGASLVLRGTYRQEAGQLTLEMTLLDPTGAPRLREPISMTFAGDQAAQAAARAAALLISELGGVLWPPPSYSLPQRDLEGAAASLLLLDRGAPRLAQERWRTGPASWSRWPLLADLQAAAALRLEEADRMEARLRESWLREPSLDAAASLDALLQGLRWPGRPGMETGGADPGPYRVLGREGLLHIRGERP